MKKFWTSSLCMPDLHYMVDIRGKIRQIRKMVDDGTYFTINRARQYGKTTTLFALQRALHDDYICILISFEGLGDESFESEASFCEVILRRIQMDLRFTSAAKEPAYLAAWYDPCVLTLSALSLHIDKMCNDRKVVLLIDEVDKVSNHKIFLNFLSLLRDLYIGSLALKMNTFHSVILSSVHDIKNIKLLIVNKGLYEPHKHENLYNFPWNIAVNFDIDMSFCPDEIASMLNDYENDHRTGMRISEIADQLFAFTYGYPFLVSRICQIVDETGDIFWSTNGILDAVKILLLEKNTLFDDMSKNLENNPALYDFIYELLILGEQKNFSTDNPLVDLAAMVGIIKNTDGKAGIANQIFEMRITRYFISKDETSRKNDRITGVLKHDVIYHNTFDMERCLLKFAEHYHKIYNESDEKFIERHGRLLFLSYLSPLLNGQGFYHIESQLTDTRRMDLVIDYGSEQFIIELKLWYGEKAHQEAYDQLVGYLVQKNTKKGYLVTFDFRQIPNRNPKAEWIQTGHDDTYMIFDLIL